MVNLLGATGASERWSFPGGRLLVTPRGIGPRLSRLAECFHIVWATTWGHDAPEVFGQMLGVGSGWPVLEFEEEKWPAILEAAAQRPFAWVDDNAARDVPAGQRPPGVAFVHTDAAAAPERVRGLVLVTDPRTGLDDRTAALLQRFGRGCLCRGG